MTARTEIWCPRCSTLFETFEQLSDHARTVHDVIIRSSFHTRACSASICRAGLNIWYEVRQEGGRGPRSSGSA